MGSNKSTDIIEWDERYAIGIDEIDRQHQYLFELTALFSDQILNHARGATIDDILATLKNYAAQHFELEETYFKDHPEADFHRQIHHAFLLQLEAYEEQYSDSPAELNSEILRFLRHWLITHISETDKRFLST
ncbi:MAG: hypothetical protein D6B25_02630 [Desulfobulbaceae bacterium]|nr:MAG: hypothetical protein D6B25_02630 [Desulfobulbaceae bacterium]